MLRTVFGSAARNALRANGRYSRTFRMPTFSPRAVRWSTASCAVSAPDPISTITRSAAGSPAYSNSP